MTSQVDNMRQLAESLVASAEALVAGAETRQRESAAQHEERIEDLAAMSEAVAQMRADTDAEVAATEAARKEQAAEDAAARAEFETARLEQAGADKHEREQDIAAMAADVAQMRADTDAEVAATEAARKAQAADDAAARAEFETARLEQADADKQGRIEHVMSISAGVRQMNLDNDAIVAEYAATRVAGAEILGTAMRAINDIRNGVVSAPPAKKAKPKPKAAPKPEPEADSRPSPDQIFAFIADNPDGVSLAEMEAHFGTPRIVLQRPVKEMLDVDHEITKDEATGKYFAV